MCSAADSRSERCSARQCPVAATAASETRVSGVDGPGSADAGRRDGRSPAPRTAAPEPGGRHRPGFGRQARTGQGDGRAAAGGPAAAAAAAAAGGGDAQRRRRRLVTAAAEEVQDGA